jgi:drug/metabolite transporter (DMT)-like permease
VVVTSTYPLITALLSALLLRERLAALQYIGVVLVVAGLALLLGVGNK